MPVRTAETLNPYRMSRIIPMMLGATRGLIPRTISIRAGEPLILSSSEPSSVTLTGRWMLLGWKVGPDESTSLTAGIQVICDGITVASDYYVRTNEYIVGPSKSKTSPGGGGTDGYPIPQFAICENAMQLSGQVTTGSGLMQTDFAAVQLEYV